MGEYDKYYDLGIKLWNRNQIDEARYYLDKAVERLELRDTYDKEKLIEFYSRFECKDCLIKILKHMIKNKEGLSLAINTYLDIVGDEVEYGELIELESLRQSDLDQEIKFKIANLYYNKKYYLKSYELFTGLLDYVESDSRKLPNDSIYVDSVLKVIGLEYEFDNFVQARVQLRKLINRCFNSSKAQAERVIYWAVVLNIFNEMLSKSHWMMAIKELDSKELKTLTFVLYKMYKGEVKEKIIALLNTTSFYDENLIYRANVMKMYLKKCSNDKSWMEDIEKIDIKKCYLATLMSYEKNKSSAYFDSSLFFNKYYKYHADIPQIINSFWNRDGFKSKKILGDISIQFVGGADSIGGSSVLISYKDSKILLDAGANINSSDFLPKFEYLKEQGIELSDIDYLIISHGHLDHTGASPYVYKNNPNIKVIATDETKDIMKIMLEDTLKINNKKGIDIYNAQDIKNLVSSIDVVDFEKEHRVSDDMSITLYKAGHILGAACVYIKLGETTLLYTGDYSMSSQHTVESLTLPENLKVDVVITESTYAYQPTNFELNEDMRKEMLVNEILKVTQDNGVVLIPAFAVGRAQEIVMLIKDYFKKEVFLPFDLYIDGKVVEVCSIYEQSSNTKDDVSIYGGGITTVNERYKGDNEIPISKFRGSCIIASSGMLNDNSRSSKYASTIIDDEKSLILFSGYLDEESPGKQLVNELRHKLVPVINLDGVAREVRCKVKSYRLSAHVKKNQIVELIGKLRPKYTFIVHGDICNKYKYFDDEVLGKEIYPEMDEMLKYISDVKFIKPKNGDIFNLSKII